MRLRFFNTFFYSQILKIRHYLLFLRAAYFHLIFGVNISYDSRVSFKARIDLTNPKGLFIGKKTLISFDAKILSHDFSTRRHYSTTHIGDCCFIGCGAIILPDVNIGDHCIVAAGSVVTKDVPSNSIVAGNPASVIRSNILTTEYGRIINSETE